MDEERLRELDLLASRN
jgi:tetratricopeptide (TPR) repeat protein